MIICHHHSIIITHVKLYTITVSLSVILSAALLKLNSSKNSSGEFFKEKAQKFAIEIEAIKNENQNLQQEAELSKNETQIYQNDLQNLQNEIEILNQENANYEQEAEMIKNQIRNLEHEAERNANETQNLKSQIEDLQEEVQNAQNNSFNQFENNSLEPTGSIFISLIRQIEDAQEVDICAGTSTDLGYFTAKSCCQGDQIYLFDQKTYDELTIPENSMWIDENICLINTTDISKLSVENLEFEEKQTCVVDVFDDGEFKEHHFDLEVKQCFGFPCTYTIDDNLFENGTILNGTSVLCRQSNHLGTITKSKFLNSVNR